jgi:hypothetical protein
LLAAVLALRWPKILSVTSSEFMVEEHELRKEKIQEDYNDKYWDQRYTVVPQQIPSFLQKVAGKILSTGDCSWAFLSLCSPMTSSCHSLAPAGHHSLLAPGDDLREQTGGLLQAADHWWSMVFRGFLVT